jgi:poly(A) polymerase/tRNA nucleotidyltransferase (CCA-adding enzyme)
MEGKGLDIPRSVVGIIEKLDAAGYRAYLVGGCVRDLLRGVKPHDWDFATRARPEEVLALFPDGVYENKFGTVLVPLKEELGIRDKTESFGAVRRSVSDGGRNQELGENEDRIDRVEITTFRTEAAYSDKRHPDAVKFADTIEEDLSRRDFTINAMALPFSIQHSAFSISDPVDPFSGQEDLKNKIIRAVGNPRDRFQEDALRLMRAVRFAAQLGFTIEPKTLSEIKENARLIDAIAKERVRDELTKIIMAPEPEKGLFLLEGSGLLRRVIPELSEGVGVSQNKHHVYTIFEHNVYSLMYAAKYNYSFAVRLASLLHDVGKSRTKQGDGPNATFYNHDIVGARLAAGILDRLRFPKDITEKVVTLVRYHLFFYDVGVVTESSVRRLLKKVGPENMQELIQVRIAERKGSGVPKARPYRLRHFEFMLEKVQRDPLSVGMLKIKGNEIMQATGLKPGPRIGWILNALLEEVLDEPKRNGKDYLTVRVKELNNLSDDDLRVLADKGREKKEGLEEKAEEEIKERYWVK